jgi:hypothetical protein
MEHFAIVVTSIHWDRLDQAYGRAVAIFPKGSVTEPVTSPINGYKSFMVGTNGSKEGWAESGEGYRLREMFIKYLDSFSYPDGSNGVRYVEVVYGCDDKRRPRIGDYN